MPCEGFDILLYKEVSEVIKEIKLGNMLEPVGLSGSYYKCLEDDIYKTQ